ncbi:Beta-ketoadipate enol-lactone hydrolase [Candidatus Rhodobacter oscarellae]|uniref:Beta-ketoadipate enol-lactone hydrolase n=1 Tax=Candidatus Rhodobacter oscarellae TaxID=1675527 RepID=A0A0J9E989_9RHOB|nr:alpha/beta fold hydrolase [Candidatus Rhodobacter lobularis]KMW58234.1 Beta-ketoadipate enol-lactone hydrolase [Candidatus Rhodobacter lobularis]
MSERAPDGTAFTLAGPEGAPVVALIHGLGLCRAVFNGMLPDLAGHRVLSYDLYGHGESAAAPRDPSLALYGDQLAGLMDHLGLAQAHVVGFSIGGMINRRFALDHPGRVASLVILNAPHDRGAGQEEVEARARTVRDKGAMATMDAALKRWFTPSYLQTGPGPNLVREWRAQVDAESYAGAAWVLAHGVRELVDKCFTAPTLVMTCENDTGSTPAMSEAIAAQCATPRLKIIPKLQHLGLMEDPQAFTAPILDFLESQT